MRDDDSWIDDCLEDYEPYNVTCAGCGAILCCEDAIVEEGDRWECVNCWEKFNAKERAEELSRKFKV